jgi:ribose 5-phosphate isomerase B
MQSDSYSHPSNRVVQQKISVAIGGDHAGFSLKSLIIEHFSSQAMQWFDCGTDSELSCDFPDFAEKVALELLSGRAQRGILVCGSGVGVSVTANKIPGIRASVCHDTYSARQGVEHDDMNVLCIGARIVGSELAKEIVTAFMNASYTPQPRHQSRLDKMLDIERRALEGFFSNLQK